MCELTGDRSSQKSPLKSVNPPVADLRYHICFNAKEKQLERL